MGWDTRQWRKMPTTYTLQSIGITVDLLQQIIVGLLEVLLAGLDQLVDNIVDLDSIAHS